MMKVIKKKMKAFLSVLYNMWIKYLTTIKLFLLIMIILTSFNLCSEQLQKDEQQQHHQSVEVVEVTVNVTIGNSSTDTEEDLDYLIDVVNSTSTAQFVNVNVTDVFNEENSTAITAISEEEEELIVVQQPKPQLFFRRLVVPKGTVLSFTGQVARTKILPGFFFDEDGVVTDAIVQVPIWLDIDELITAVYGAEGGDDDERKRSLSDYIGTERCFLYKKTEQLFATLFQVPAALSRSCMLRTMCEIHAAGKFYPHVEHSFAFEILLLLFTPSLTSSRLNCYKPYLMAEKNGKLGICSRYTSKCPLSISSFIFKHILPSVVH